MSDDVRPTGRVGSTAGDTAGAVARGQESDSSYGWVGAIGIGIAAVVLLWLLLLLAPHLLLTRVVLLPRSGRVALATAWIVAATCGLLTLAARAGRANRTSA